MEAKSEGSQAKERRKRGAEIMCLWRPSLSSPFFHASSTVKTEPLKQCIVLNTCAVSYGGPWASRHYRINSGLGNKSLLVSFPSIHPSMAFVGARRGSPWAGQPVGSFTVPKGISHCFVFSSAPTPSLSASQLSFLSLFFPFSGCRPKILADVISRAPKGRCTRLECIKKQQHTCRANSEQDPDDIHHGHYIDTGK